MERIGFIGLGIMGRPMARNLLKAGYSVRVYDIVPERIAELVASGAQPADSARAVAEASDVAITMLPDGPDVERAVLGPGGVLEGAREGLLLVDMSSISPLVARRVAAAAAAKGVVLLDAPVSGGEPKAIEGTLAIMVGGPEDAFERAKPILSAMGRSVVRVGDVGSGNVAKLANQIIVGLNIAALSEAMVFATKAGVDPEKVYQAIRGGLAGSAVLEAKMPLVLEGNFKPGFRIELHAKDLRNALAAAGKLSVPLILSAGVLGMMQGLCQEGHGGDDHGGLVQFYEEACGVEVRRSPEARG